MCIILFFFFNDTATTEIYTLSLHDALPILARGLDVGREQRSLHCIVFEDEDRGQGRGTDEGAPTVLRGDQALLFELVERSEEHTSELQSQSNIVCRLLLEKKKSIASSCIIV